MASYHERDHLGHCLVRISRSKYTRCTSWKYKGNAVNTNKTQIKNLRKGVQQRVLDPQVQELNNTHFNCKARYLHWLLRPKVTQNNTHCSNTVLRREPKTTRKFPDRFTCSIVALNVRKIPTSRITWQFVTFAEGEMRCWSVYIEHSHISTRLWKLLKYPTKATGESAEWIFRYAPMFETRAVFS